MLLVLFLPFSLFHDPFHSVYHGMRSNYPVPNERIPLVDVPGFSISHPSFGKPVNGFDLFHGTKKDAVSSIMTNGFDDHFFNPEGYFGAGAYFADDPGLSFSYLGGGNPGHMFVSSVILGNTDDQHWHAPLDRPLGTDFRPAKGVDSLKGRIHFPPFGVRQSEYIVYRFGQCKATYLLRFDVN